VNEYKNTALHTACERANLSVVKTLLYNWNADPNALNHQRNTPLHKSASMPSAVIPGGTMSSSIIMPPYEQQIVPSANQSGECMKLLLARGGDLLIQNERGARIGVCDTYIT